MAHDIADQDRPVGRLEDRLARRIHAGENLHVRIFGEIFGERFVEAEPALLPQCHQRDAGDRLGHRPDLGQGVAPEWLLRFAVGVAGGPEIDLAAVLPDQHRSAGDAAVVDHLPKRPVDPRLDELERRRLRRGGRRLGHGRRARQASDEGNCDSCDRASDSAMTAVIKLSDRTAEAPSLRKVKLRPMRRAR